MTQIAHNLINELKNLPTITQVERYFDYVKINTTCPIKYCNEFLVLYAQFNGENILISDLNTILEDAIYCKINISDINSCIKKNNLDFDGVSVFKLTNFKNFFSLFYLK